MEKRKTIYGVIGFAAFIVGGILMRDKALESAEKVEEFFASAPKKPSSN